MRVVCGVVLSELYLGTYFFKCLLQSLSLFLSNAFLQLAGSSVYEVLSFLQAETAGFLHGLNDLEL